MGQRQGHQAPSSGERPERGNLYEEVTARVVAELEQGRVPWVQPWGSGKAALGLPRNGLSGQRYSARRDRVSRVRTTASLHLGNPGHW